MATCPGCLIRPLLSLQVSASIQFPILLYRKGAKPISKQTVIQLGRFEEVIQEELHRIDTIRVAFGSRFPLCLSIRTI